MLFERRIVSPFGMASGGKVLNGGSWSAVGGWLLDLWQRWTAGMEDLQLIKSHFHYIYGLLFGPIIGPIGVDLG